MTRARVKGSESCECGAGPFTRRGLSMHRRLIHGAESEDRPGAAPRRESAGTGRARVAPSDSALQEEGRKLVTNLSVVAMFVTAVLPVTGATIMRRLGDRTAVDPLTNEPIEIDGVRQTKRGIGSVVMDAARQDERILEGVRKFNRFFELEDAVELVASVGAAVAVDMGIDPHVGLDAGPLGHIAPIEQLIGDVIEDMEEAGERELADESSPAESASSNGVATGGAHVIPGGVTST